MICYPCNTEFVLEKEEDGVKYYKCPDCGRPITETTTEP